MCGLFCSVGFAPDPGRIDIVAHRGPDGRGWETFATPAGPLALGHRRLAIIDTSKAGLQPMTDPSGRWRILLNGEIYNYRELRADLEAAGIAFHSMTDTEVLLQALIRWGASALPRLRGMFAFILYDQNEQTILAARDRYGIKPLYFVECPAGVALASEIKQLIDLGGAGRRMNRARVLDFLEAGLTDHTAETMFDGVRQLRGGELVTIDVGRASTHMSARRWADDAAPQIAITEAESAERFRELLRDSVRLHLRSDVPLGSCLSGGLDSSSIVATMAEQSGGSDNITTVSACFVGTPVDEKPFMDAVIERTNVNPLFVFPKADDLFACIDDMTWHQDEPVASTSVFAQWRVFEAARGAGLRVMLDGQGADELLAGYHWNHAWRLAGLLRAGRLSELARDIREWRDWHGAGVASQALRMGGALLPSSLATPMKRLYDGLGRPWLLQDANRAPAMQTAYRSIGVSPPRDLGALCRAMVAATSLPMLLHYEDRSSMAHSIEARVPFLDPPLAEFCLALGGDHKMAGGETKRVLRRAMSDFLPAKVAQRRDKLGFATPESMWLQGPLRGSLLPAIEATMARFPDLFDAGQTRKLVSRFLETGAFGSVPWRIANLGVWGDRFKLSAG